MVWVSTHIRVNRRIEGSFGTSLSKCAIAPITSQDGLKSSSPLLRETIWVVMWSAAMEWPTFQLSQVRIHATSMSSVRLAARYCRVFSDSSKALLQSMYHQQSFLQRTKEERLREYHQSASLKYNSMWRSKGYINSESTHLKHEACSIKAARLLTDSLLTFN